MSKFDEILNSSDASDALLGEQIDKITPSWSMTNISTTSLGSVYFSNSDSLTQYYDKSLNRVILVLKGTTSKAIPAKTAIGVGSVTSNDLIPKGAINAYYASSDGTKQYRFMKNNSDLAVALTNLSSNEIPVGTSINLQIEYTILPKF